MAQTSAGGRTISLAAVAEELRSLDRFSDDEPLRAVAAGEDLELALADPGALRNVCEGFISIANQFGCHQVLGASPLGNRLAAGVVALGGNELRLFHQAESASSVLVIDGLLVTGVQIAQAGQMAIRAGASRVCGAVVMTARPDLHGTLGSLTEPLVVLGP